MMNKRVLNSFLYGTLLFSLGTGVVSCKDYDSDIEGLNNRITTVESDMDRFKEKIEAALNANLTVQSWYRAMETSCMYRLPIKPPLSTSSRWKKAHGDIPKTKVRAGIKC